MLSKYREWPIHKYLFWYRYCRLPCCRFVEFFFKSTKYKKINSRVLHISDTYFCLGWFVEKFGRPLLLLFLGCLIFTGTCFLMSLSSSMVTPIVGCVGTHFFSFYSVSFGTGAARTFGFFWCMGIPKRLTLVTRFFFFCMGPIWGWRCNWPALAFGLCLGLFEPTLYTCLAAVLPEKGSSTAFTFSSLIFQVSFQFFWLENQRRTRIFWLEWNRKNETGSTQVLLFFVITQSPWAELKQTMSNFGDTFRTKLTLL